MLTQDLRAVARQAMIDEGFNPDPDPAVLAERQNIGKQPDAGAPLRDLYGLLWSSIDNDDTRDLDHAEVAVDTDDGDWRRYSAIADVDSEVRKGSAVDAYAAAQTTTVYTGAVIFPMIPTELSAGATSLFESAERKSVVVEMIVGADGAVKSAEIYRARVTNKAQLTYSAVAAWLDGGDK